MSSLLPKGCISLIDAPHNLTGAIKMALAFLGWQENLSKKEMPPKRIWFNEKKLNAWFKQIEKDRDLEMKGKSNTEEGWDGEFKQNAAARLLIAED